MRTQFFKQILSIYNKSTQFDKSMHTLILPSLLTFCSFFFFLNFTYMAGNITSTQLQQQQGMENHEENVLQKHVMFFDRNNDGLIYPSETFQGFRAIGCGVLLSSVAAVFINLGLSRKTRPGKSFDVHFPIEVKNIQMSKHGSDSGVYDKHGRFNPSKFEEIFVKHAQSNSNALTAEELDALLKSNREPKDYAGWVAGYVEWKILYSLCKDEHGLLHKDTVKAAYDGSLFERMAKETEMKKESKKNHK